MTVEGAECGFQEWDVMEVDHKIPRAIGGKDEWNNLQLLHRHCHDEKTAQDLIEIRQKEHSKFLKKLAQKWSRYEWEWINDIPTIKTQAVNKSCSDKRKVTTLLVLTEFQMWRNAYPGFSNRAIGLCLVLLSGAQAQSLAVEILNAIRRSSPTP